MIYEEFDKITVYKKGEYQKKKVSEEKLQNKNKLKLEQKKEKELRQTMIY